MIIIISTYSQPILTPIKVNALNFSPINPNDINKFNQGVRKYAYYFWVAKISQSLGTVAPSEASCKIPSIYVLPLM
jgi:hypothetical protein